MKSGTEPVVQKGLEEILARLGETRFGCRVRKSTGESVIGKPVDLEIYLKGPQARAVVAVEVANVNTTQLVGETCRLYYDACALKLLVLGDRNLPRNGKDQCELLLARLYGQNSIANTPARVVWYFDDDSVARALCELLQLAYRPLDQIASDSTGGLDTVVPTEDSGPPHCPICGDIVTAETRGHHEVCEIRNEDEQRRGAKPPVLGGPPPSWDNVVRRIEE